MEYSRLHPAQFRPTLRIMAEGFPWEGGSQLSPLSVIHSLAIRRFTVAATSSPGSVPPSSVCALQDPIMSVQALYVAAATAVQATRRISAAIAQAAPQASSRERVIPRVLQAARQGVTSRHFKHAPSVRRASTCRPRGPQRVPAALRASTRRQEAFPAQAAPRDSLLKWPRRRVQSARRASTLPLPTRLAQAAP